MQAVRALYRDGQIRLLSPLTSVRDAEILIIVLDEDSEVEAAKSSFFAKSEDSNVDWEEVFCV